MYRGCTDVWGSVQMYRAYRHIGRCTGGIQMYGGHTEGVVMYDAYRCTGGADVLGCVQMYGGVYRCIGHTDIWEIHGGVQTYRGIQMYGECTIVWGEYRYMGDVQIYGALLTYGEMYGDMQTYKGNTVVWGCTDVWGAYRCIGGCVDLWRCTDMGVIQTPPDIQTAIHNPHMPTNYTWVLYFL